MDGQVEYAKTIREINAIMNTAAKEYKNHVAAMGTDAAATDKLRAEKKKLEIQMEAAQKRTQMLREQYEQMSKSTKTTTGQLAQMYSKLLDSERAETSLQKSLDRVNEGLSDEAQEARAASEKLNDLKDESKLLEAEQKKLVSEFKYQNESLDQNADESEKTALAQKQLARQMNLTEKVVKNLEQQLASTKKIYGENSVEVKQMETKLNEAKTTISNFKKSLESIETSGKKTKKSLSGIGKGMQAVAGAAPTAAIGGLVSSMEDYNIVLARLKTNADQAGLSMDDVNGAFNQMQVASNDADSSVEGVSNLIAAGFDPSQILAASKAISGAAIKWSETLNVEGLSDAVQETIAGGKSIGMFDELLSRSGVNIDKFNQGLAKASKTGQAQQYVFERLTTLGLGVYLDKYKELNPEVAKQQESQQKMTDALSKLSLVLSPLITFLAEFTTKLVEFVNENPKLTAGVAAVTMGIGALVAAASLLAPIFTAVATVVGGGVAVSFGALASAILPVIAVIAGVVAAVIAVIAIIKNWGKITDWISDKWDKFTSWLSAGTSSLAKSFVKDFTNMKDGAVGKFNDLKSKAGKTLSSFKENVVNKASEMKKGFVNKTADLKEGAVGKFNDLKSKAGKTISSFKDNVVNKASDMRRNFVGKAGDLRDGAVDKFNSLKSKAGKIFNAAKNVIVSPIEKAKDKVGSIIEKIKGFFHKMKLKIPKIGMPKLPHFKLEGKFSLKPPSVPRLSVDWRAKGAIFTEPTIFGMNNGRLQGAGDAGPEAALPLNDETLGAIGRGIAATMNGNGETTIHLTVDLDGATVARKTVKYTARELYTLQQNKSRGGGKV